MTRKKDIPPEVLEYFKREGGKGGKKGGPARMAKLTPEQRAELAKKAAAARWAKAGAKKAVRKRAVKKAK